MTKDLKKEKKYQRLWGELSAAGRLRNAQVQSANNQITQAFYSAMSDANQNTPIDLLQGLSQSGGDGESINKIKEHIRAAKEKVVGDTNAKDLAAKVSQGELDVKTLESVLRSTKGEDERKSIEADLAEKKKSLSYHQQKLKGYKSSKSGVNLGSIDEAEKKGSKQRQTLDKK